MRVPNPCSTLVSQSEMAPRSNDLSSLSKYTGTYIRTCMLPHGISSSHSGVISDWEYLNQSPVQNSTYRCMMFLFCFFKNLGIPICGVPSITHSCTLLKQLHILCVGRNLSKCLPFKQFLHLYPPLWLYLWLSSFPVLSLFPHRALPFSLIFQHHTFISPFTFRCPPTAKYLRHFLVHKSVFGWSLPLLFIVAPKSLLSDISNLLDSFRTL